MSYGKKTLIVGKKCRHHAIIPLAGSARNDMIKREIGRSSSISHLALEK
jgi:hypothetical protein